MLTILDAEPGLEVKIEMLNSVLYASDEVIKSMAEFVKSPTYSSYIKTASAMRKDLWNRKAKIGEDILKEFAADPSLKLRNRKCRALQTLKAFSVAATSNSFKKFPRKNTRWRGQRQIATF